MASLMINHMTGTCELRNLGNERLSDYRIRIICLRNFSKTASGNSGGSVTDIENISIGAFKLSDYMGNADGIYQFTLYKAQNSEVVQDEIKYMGWRTDTDRAKVSLKVEVSGDSYSKQISLKSNICLNVDDEKDYYLARDSHLIPIPPFREISDKTYKYGIVIKVDGSKDYSIRLNPGFESIGCYKYKTIDI